jgi:hypothetical protein
MITNGFAFGWSDLATIDTNFPYASSYLSISGTAGDIVYENTGGFAQWYPGAIQGFMYPIGAKRILSSGTVNGTLRTTTATGIVYCSAGTP